MLSSADCGTKYNMMFFFLNYLENRAKKHFFPEKNRKIFFFTPWHEKIRKTSQPLGLHNFEFFRVIIRGLLKIKNFFHFYLDSPVLSAKWFCFWWWVGPAGRSLTWPCWSVVADSVAGSVAVAEVPRLSLNFDETDTISRHYERTNDSYRNTP